jgi:tRNA threonylcarbamoyladenosine biosynthesis protein TsaB
MIVVGIETSTPQVSVAIGNDGGILGRIQVVGFAVGIGPGLFTGLRVGVETAKTLAQATHAMILGFTSLDTLAYSVRFTNRTILAVVDARRGEVFSATYGTVPGGVVRESAYTVSTPQHVAADVAASREGVLAVGDGAILYRDVLQEQHGARIEVASAAVAHPDAASLVELALPRFLREEHDALFDVAPLYLRKSDAEIAWDRRAGRA